MRRALRIRPLATADIDHAAAYLLTENPPAAVAFLDALESAFALLSEQPGMGSPRYAHLIPAEILRMWPLAGFPYLIFYLERDAALDIVRVLHTARDLPTLLTES